MKPHSPARKALTILAALALAGAALWVGSRTLLVSGTKSTFSSVHVRAVPGGGPAATTTATTDQAAPVPKAAATPTPQP